MSTVTIGKNLPAHYACGTFNLFKREFQYHGFQIRSPKKIHVTPHKIAHREATILCTRITLDMKLNKDIKNEECRKIRDVYFGKKYSVTDKLHPLSNSQLAEIIYRNQPFEKGR